MDKSRVNDREYMRQEMLVNHKAVQLLGEDLRKNPDFIMEMVKDDSFKYYWALLKVIDKGLINNDFMIPYMRALYDRGVLNYNSIQQFSPILPQDFLRDNKAFWDTLIELGITDYEVGDKEDLSRRRRQKIAEMMSRIETVTVEEFRRITTETYRDNPKFMLKVISKNPSLYVCLSPKLKANLHFRQVLISKVPGVATIIEADEAKKQEERQAQRSERKRQKEEEKRKEKLEEEDRIRREYKEQGEQHPNLILVKDFLIANTSKSLYCSIRNIPISQLDIAIQEVCGIYPEIALEVAKKNAQASAIHLNTIESINSKLLSGEMTLKQYSREFYKGKKIKTLLSHITDKNERKQFHTLVVNAIASGELTMMDYLRLFSEEYDYRTITNSINTYMNTASKEMPELKGKGKSIDRATIEIKTLRKYSKPYQTKDFLGQKMGFVNSEGKIEMITITQEHIEYAKKYLHLEDEYICYATINSILLKLIKGEITFEDIDARRTENIPMKAVVANAINSGITTGEVHDFDLSTGEKSKVLSEEGVAIDE